jgi:hypothetical protein
MSVQETEVAGKPTPQRHNVFDSADLLVRLLIAEMDVGYKLVTYYTACATLYIAVVGVTAQQYFAALPQGGAKASGIAWFGFALSLLSLAGPFGLYVCRREIEARAAKYTTALALPPERFSVIRFGTWLSFCTFAVISVSWTYLVAAS